MATQGTTTDISCIHLLGGSEVSIKLFIALKDCMTEEEDFA